MLIKGSLILFTKRKLLINFLSKPYLTLFYTKHKTFRCESDDKTYRYTGNGKAVDLPQTIDGVISF